MVCLTQSTPSGIPFPPQDWAQTPLAGQAYVRALCDEAAPRRHPLQAFENLSLRAQGSPSPAPSSGPGPVALACCLLRLVLARGPPRVPVRRGGLPVVRSATGTPRRAPRLGVWGTSGRGARWHGMGARGRQKRPCEFPSMLPLLSSPLAEVFLPRILWALCRMTPIGLAASCGAGTHPSPTTFSPCGLSYPSPDALCVLRRELEGLWEATPSIRRLSS